MIEAGVCLLAYFIVFWDHNIQASELKHFYSQDDLDMTFGN